MLGIVGLYHILKFPDISWYIICIYMYIIRPLTGLLHHGIYIYYWLLASYDSWIPVTSQDHQGSMNIVDFLSKKREKNDQHQ